MNILVKVRDFKTGLKTHHTHITHNLQCCLFCLLLIGGAPTTHKVRGQEISTIILGFHGDDRLQFR